MRIANLNDRAILVRDSGYVDLATASGGRIGPDPRAVLASLPAVRAWLAEAEPADTEQVSPDELASSGRLGPVVSDPSQIFAVGLNYRTHAAEMGLTPPSQPMIFTKFPSSLTGPASSFRVPSETTDWEAELVVVLGARARRLSVDTALDAVAGLCVGQDLSDRGLQMAGSPAQFSLGKSHEGFAPVGPWVTTLDDAGNPQDLRIECRLNGAVRQDSSTSDMVFTVAEIVAYLSHVVELRPGDLVFTGSPPGVGQGQRPPVFLAPGDVLETRIAGLGALRNVATA